MCKCPGVDWVEHKLYGRGKQKVSGLYAYLKNKTSVVLLENEYDRLCMARAIVISRAALQQGRDNPRFVKIRRQD